MNAEQARALRDIVAVSTRWCLRINITDNNAFLEAFFVKAVLASKRVDMDVVYVDDTACTNAFMFPVVVMAVRDASHNVHAAAWGF